MTLDFMESCLSSFFRSTGWDAQNSFATLTESSRALLDFLPSCVPAALVLGKNISPHLMSAFSIGLPHIRTASFLFSSHPISHQPRTINDDLAEYVLSRRSIQHHHVSSQQPYLLYGKLFEDGRIEAMGIRRISRNCQLTLTGLNALSPPLSQCNACLQYDAQSWSSEISYSSQDSLVGIRGLYNLLASPCSNLSVGAELTLARKESSGGGLLFGSRYRFHHPTSNEDLDLTCTFNPVMGHISLAHTTTATPDLFVSTRFDFNAYSLDSDLAIGFAYAPKGKDQMLKCRFNQSGGVALTYERRVGECFITVGVASEIHADARQTVGIELQYSK